jgi:hypothetical protein
MSLRDVLLAEKAEIDRKLAILNRSPTDTFPFGTIVVFSKGTTPADKWYYLKVSEETWKDMQSGEVRDLASWILTGEESAVGYFEVYKMTVDTTPIYTTS